MPDPAFPELKRLPRHRKPDELDPMLLGLKIATFLAACGLVAVIVLLVALSGPNSKATPRHQVPGPTPSQPTNTPSAKPVPAAFEPPAMRTEMTNISAEPPPPPTRAPKPSAPKPTPPPQPSPPPAPQPTYPVAGEPCSNPGTMSRTREGRRVLCASIPRGSQPRWYLVRYGW
jgi:hypothetical protein